MTAVDSESTQTALPSTTALDPSGSTRFVAGKIKDLKI
jgi:hypothetical protein